MGRSGRGEYIKNGRSESRSEYGRLMTAFFRRFFHDIDEVYEDRYALPHGRAAEIPPLGKDSRFSFSYESWGFLHHEVEG